MATTVRRATELDADGVFALVQRFATSYTPDRLAFNRVLPTVLDKADRDLIIAEESSNTVGYVLAVDQPTFFANGPVTEVVELFVNENSRKQGIGRRLVEEACAAARARGSVEVTVPTRRAGDFYEKVGFERTAKFYKRSI